MSMALTACTIPMALITPVMWTLVQNWLLTPTRPIKAPTGAAPFVNPMEIRVELCCWRRTVFSRLSLPLVTNTATQSARSNVTFAFPNKNNLFTSISQLII